MSTQQKYIDIKEQRGQYWLENIMKDKFAVSMFGQKRLSREGGIEIVVKELCTRMARDGCQVTCYILHIFGNFGSNRNVFIFYRMVKFKPCTMKCLP